MRVWKRSEPGREGGLGVPQPHACRDRGGTEGTCPATSLQRCPGASPTQPHPWDGCPWGWEREAARSPICNCKSQFFSFFSSLMTVGSPYKKPERRERGVGRDQGSAATWGDVDAGRGFPARSLLRAAPSPGSDPYGSLCLPVGFILPSPSRM